MNFEYFSADVETQTIYLDKTGYLQNSCDSLFSTVGWQKGTILRQFPLLKSIFAGLAKMQVGNHPIHIPKVESATGLPNGFYDFSFVCLEIEGKDFIRWVIYDYTQKYSQLQETQQSQHDDYIAKDKKL
ncbi:MAG: hypothetical protein AB8G22_19825 [Saprospiraceae bacterium]